MSHALPAAGWFADPSQPDQLRWWDGTAWTQHVHPAVVQPAAETRDTTPLSVLRDDTQWELFPHRTKELGRPMSAAEIAQVPSRWKLMLSLMSTRRKVLAVIGFILIVVIPLMRIVAVVALIGYGIYTYRGKTGVPKLDALKQWASERGLQYRGGLVAWADGAAPLDAASFDQCQHALRAGIGNGRLFTHSNALQVRGPLWLAAGDADITQVVASESNQKRRASATLIDIPLEQQWADRLTGICGRFGDALKHVSRSNAISINGIELPIGDRPERDVIGHHLKGFHTVNFENTTKASKVKIAVRRDQDLVPVYELFDPAFLVDLEDRLGALSMMSGGGFIIAGGMLTVWFCGSSLTDVASERVRNASTGARGECESALDGMLVIARDIHRRVYAEWQ